MMSRSGRNRNCPRALDYRDSKSGDRRSKKARAPSPGSPEAKSNRNDANSISDRAPTELRMRSRAVLRATTDASSDTIGDSPSSSTRCANPRRTASSAARGVGSSRPRANAARPARPRAQTRPTDTSPGAGCNSTPRWRYTRSEQSAISRAAPRNRRTHLGHGDRARSRPGFQSDPIDGCAPLPTRRSAHAEPPVHPRVRTSTSTGPPPPAPDSIPLLSSGNCTLHGSSRVAG